MNQRNEPWVSFSDETPSAFFSNVGVCYAPKYGDSFITVSRQTPFRAGERVAAAIIYGDDTILELPSVSLAYRDMHATALLQLGADFGEESYVRYRQLNEAARTHGGRYELVLSAIAALPADGHISLVGR